MNTPPDGERAFPKSTPYSTQCGMSLRAYIATAAMQGIAASDTANTITPERLATWSVQCADALIAELDKEPV